MGDLIASCITCRKNEQNLEIPSKPPNLSNTYSKNTNLTQNPENSGYIKPNDFIKFYDTSPFEKYEEIDTLGRGAYGLVKKVRLKCNNETVRAMKIIKGKKLKDGISKKLLDEINIVGKLQNPNIMKIYECYHYKDNIYIISDFYNEGDLLRKLEKMAIMNEFIVRYLMRQILGVVKSLHYNRVFHGDIKLENIMVHKTANRRENRGLTKMNASMNQNDNSKELEKNSKYLDDMSDYEIKFIDFGCSKYLKKGMNGIVGTSAYCSPEVIENSYDEKSDEWSCGVLMYILLCHDLPFKGKTEEEIFDNVKKYNVDFDRKELKNISNECMDLMKRLLNPNKNKRITAANALKHPFFTKQLDPKLILTRHKDLSILKKFKKIEKYPTIIHKVVIAYCCFHLIDEKERKKLNELYLYLDSKNKNKLSLGDFKEGFKEAKIPISDYEIKEILKILDTDGSKYIEYEEFLRAFSDKDSLLNDKNLKIVFDVIDKDKKGYANINDLKNFITGDNKNNLKESTFKKFIKAIGMNKDSKLYFEKFCDIIRNPITEIIKVKRSNSFVFSSDSDRILIKDKIKSNKNKKNEKRASSHDNSKFKFK